MSDTSPVEIATTGELFDNQGHLVQLKPTKAVIGGALGFISMVTTGLTAIYTENPVLIIINIVVGSAATVLGIFLPTNGVKR